MDEATEFGFSMVRQVYMRLPLLKCHATVNWHEHRVSDRYCSSDYVTAMNGLTVRSDAMSLLDIQCHCSDF